MSKNLKFRNHFIPQMILKNFTNSANKIYQYDISKGDWSSPNGTKSDGSMTTAAVGKENYLYVHLDGAGLYSDSLENGLGTIESDIAPIIEKLIAHNKKEWFSDVHLLLNLQDYVSLFMFLAIGYLRTPSHINQAMDIMGSVCLIEFENYLRNENITTPELEAVNLESLFENSQLTIGTQDVLGHILSPNSIHSIFEALLEFQWFLINNETNLSFLIGDSFVNLPTPGFRKSNDVFIPIGNHKALYGIKPPGLDSKKLNKDFKTKEKREAFIKMINGVVISNSDSFIFSASRSDNLKRYIEKHIDLTKIACFVGKTNTTHTVDCKRENANVTKRAKS